VSITKSLPLTIETGDPTYLPVIEAIRLRTEELPLFARAGCWADYISNVPLPALWVTAHVDLSLAYLKTNETKRIKASVLEQFPKDNLTRQNRDAALELVTRQIQRMRRVRAMRDALSVCKCEETKAAQYRIELQKIITQVNRKVLKSRSADRTFSFRGCLGVNSDRRNLHYHFLLWEPTGLFSREPHTMVTTQNALTTLWLDKVNNTSSNRYKPIHVEPVFNQIGAQNLASYMVRDDSFITSYEIFDDWSQSQLLENINRTVGKH
jgi:hypothetical protein